MRITLALILDAFFMAATVFLLTVSALRFYLPAASAFILSLAAGLLTGSSLFYFRGKAQKKRFLKKNEEKEMLATFRHLALSPVKEAEKHLKTAVEAFTGEASVWECPGVLCTKSARFLLFSGMVPPEKGEICAKVREVKKDLPLTAVCLFSSPETESFFRSLGVEAPPASQWYFAMKRADALPRVAEKCTEKRGTVIKNRLSGLLQKQKAKRFFFFGAWTMALSFIVPFPVYYLVLGGAFLLLSAVLILFGKDGEKGSRTV